MSGPSEKASLLGCYRRLHQLSTSCFALSFAYPYLACSLPSSCSRSPLIWVNSSSVSLPHCSFALPVNCFQLPWTRSQFIVDLLLLRWVHGLVGRSSAGTARARPVATCPGPRRCRFQRILRGVENDEQLAVAVLR